MNNEPWRRQSGIFNRIIGPIRRLSMTVMYVGRLINSDIVAYPVGKGEGEGRILITCAGFVVTTCSDL